MKKLLYSLLFILTIASYSYSNTGVDGLPGGGVSEGGDVGFGNITATSLELSGDLTSAGNIIAITGDVSANYLIADKVKIDDNGVLARIYGKQAGWDLLVAAGSKSSLTLGGDGESNITTTLDDTSGDQAAFSVLAAYSTTGTAGGTDIFVNRSTISVGSGPQNFIEFQDTNVSKFSVNTDGFIDAPGTYGHLKDQNTGLGIEYVLTPTYRTYTSYSTSGSSSNVTASTGNGTFTLDAGVSGEFDILVDISVLGVGGPTLEYGIFRNLTTEIATFVRAIHGVHHHTPTLANLSGNAGYDTYSSLEYLVYQDGNYVVIDESADGSNAFIYDTIFNGEVLYPEAVEYLGVQYTGQAAHEVEGQMWNYSTTAWVDMRSDTEDFPDSGTYEEYKFFVREFAVPDPKGSYVDTSVKESKTRVIHTSSGNTNDRFRIDKIQLHDAHNSAALSFTSMASLSGGDIISLKIKSNKTLPAYFNNVHLHLTKKSK